MVQPLRELRVAQNLVNKRSQNYSLSTNSDANCDPYITSTLDSQRLKQSKKFISGPPGLVPEASGLIAENSGCNPTLVPFLLNPLLPTYTRKRGFDHERSWPKSWWQFYFLDSERENLIYSNSTGQRKGLARCIHPVQPPLKVPNVDPHSASRELHVAAKENCKLMEAVKKSRHL